MPNERNGGSAGVGFAGLLTIVFIVLKLLGKIDWPWLWVLSPTWVSVILAVLGIIVTAFVIAWVEKKERAQRQRDFEEQQRRLKGMR